MQDKLFQRPRVIIHYIMYIPKLVNDPFKLAKIALFNEILVE